MALQSLLGTIKRWRRYVPREELNTVRHHRPFCGKTNQGAYFRSWQDVSVPPLPYPYPGTAKTR